MNPDLSKLIVKPRGSVNLTKSGIAVNKLLLDILINATSSAK